MKSAPGVESPASPLWCCAPLGFLRRGKNHQFRDEKTSSDMMFGQPDMQPEPIAAPLLDGETTVKTANHLRKTRKRRSTFSSSRTRHKSDGSSHGLLISSPTNFRHLSSGSFSTSFYEHPAWQTRRPTPPQDGSFRPLQLNIYTSNSIMSPILPNFEMPITVPSPPPAYAHSEMDFSDRPRLRQRSFSSLSFHVPRKQTADMIPSPRHETMEPAHRSEVSSPSRPRAFTSTELELRKEKIATHLIERERLQQQIDDVIERQSLYSCSRPSSAQSVARTVPVTELEPMPSIPAMPPAAPSFAERLNADIDRPSTIIPSHIARRDLATTSEKIEHVRNLASKPEPSLMLDPPLSPPPPLVLRPPLRKKKSFSSVSTWLSSHRQDLSVDSVSNSPLPIQDSDGFYQETSPVYDMDRVSSEYSFTSLYTPAIAPDLKDSNSTIDQRDEQLPMERCSTFGKNSSLPSLSSVGMAM